MGIAERFREIVAADAPLAPLVALGVGGPARLLAEPRSAEELEALLKACQAEGVPFRVLGSGSNVVPADAGVRGVVVRLSHPTFARIEVDAPRVVAGAAAALADVVEAACAAGLSGLEILAGIPGSVGGAVRGNLGTRQGDIGQVTHAALMLDHEGVHARARHELRFGYRTSNLEGGTLLQAVFELSPAPPEEIAKRLKKVWIAKRAQQPFGFQRSAYAFHSARGLSATELLDRAGLRGAKVGAAELSERDPAYIVANPGCTARDVAALTEHARAEVRAKCGVPLETALAFWD